MGVVLAGRFPAKVQKEGFFEQIRKRLAKVLSGFIAFAQDFGLAAAGQETNLRMEAPGSRIWTSLEHYGVAACNAGTEFWKG